MRATPCDRLRPLLADFQAGALDTSRAEEVGAHVATCAACAKELAALNSTAALLDATEPLRPSRDLWPQIATQLRPRQPSRAWWRGLVPATPRAAIGLAAAMLVIVALVVVLPLHWGPAPAVPLPYAADDDAALFAQWHAQASLTSGLADPYALALIAMSRPATEDATP